MNVSFEGHNIDVLPEWKRQIEDRLAEWSDPRDPVIKARCSVSYKATEIPPAETSLVVTLRGRQIVVTKRGEHVDAALKQVIDTCKREIRQFYDLRSNHRPKVVTPELGEEVVLEAEAEELVLEEELEA